MAGRLWNSVELARLEQELAVVAEHTRASREPGGAASCAPREAVAVGQAAG